MNEIYYVGKCNIDNREFYFVGITKNKKIVGGVTGDYKALVDYLDIAKKKNNSEFINWNKKSKQIFEKHLQSIDVKYKIKPLDAEETEHLEDMIKGLKIK